MTFNMNDYGEVLKAGPDALTDELRPQFEEYLKLIYKTEQGALNRNRDRIAACEEYSVSTLMNINMAKKIAYKFGVDLRDD